MTSYCNFRLFALAALFFFLPISTFAATLGFSSVNTTVDAGTTITETILVSSAGQAMNAVSGTLSFPADLLQVVSLSKAGSILSLWVQDPIFSNTEGTISFSGIAPNPGYTGSRGHILSIQFRAKKTGTATIAFSSSEVLANDGNGTNILTSAKSASIDVVAPTVSPTSSPVTTQTSSGSELLARITSSTHPDENRWYNISHTLFDWTNAQGISAVRLGYDALADTKPTVLYDDPISHKELDLDDGIWYFSVQERKGGSWGPVSSYRVNIDTVSPLPFKISFPYGTTSPSGVELLTQFTTHDELSGIDYYQIAIDGKELKVSPEEGSRPYAMSAEPGTHVLLVRAYDKAGNVSSASEKFSITETKTTYTPFDFFSFGWLAVNYISLFLIACAICVTLLFAVWYIRTHFKAYRHRLNHKLGFTHMRVHKEFDTLKEAITEEIFNLEKANSKRELTREEVKIITRFKKLLDQTEQTIEKDIEDISK